MMSAHTADKGQTQNILLAPECMLVKPIHLHNHAMHWNSRVPYGVVCVLTACATDGAAVTCGMLRGEQHCSRAPDNTVHAHCSNAGACRAVAAQAGTSIADKKARCEVYLVHQVPVGPLNASETQQSFFNNGTAAAGFGTAVMAAGPTAVIGRCLENNERALAAYKRAL
jgi:hypothetical protein